MAAGQNKGQAGGADKGKLTTILVPAAGVALIVALVVVVAATSDSPTKPTDKSGKGGPSGADAGALTSGAGKPMSDGSNGGTDDPGLKELAGGLKYRDLKEGTGQDCPPGATVIAHYAGWLVNGHEFDSSRKHGPQPTEFSLNRVVKGWQEGIPGMKVGGIRKLVIPADLGYGATGAGKDIPPNATLIFEVELVSLK